MPIQSCTLPDGSLGFKWGSLGKCYASRAQAEEQMQAAFANGYTGKVELAAELRKHLVVSERRKLCALLKASINEAANEAATSPHNLRAQPTEAQQHAGNYKKGHVKLSGMNIAIENPAGSRRHPEWPPMQAHYGYVKRTEGADGAQLDVFIKPGTPDNWNGPVFVIDQFKEDGDTFDEHKVMLGWDTSSAAEKAYKAHYPKDWDGGRYITQMDLDTFKNWMLSGDLNTPCTQQLHKLLKDWTQSASPTSGITAYGITGRKKRASLYGRVKLQPGAKAKVAELLGEEK